MKLLKMCKIMQRVSRILYAITLEIYLGQSVNIQMSNDSIFSIATLLYARLRKVSSRVIDVTYLIQDRRYAQHIMSIALETKDDDLAKYAEKLRIALCFPNEDDHHLEESKSSKQVTQENGHVSFSLF